MRTDLQRRSTFIVDLLRHSGKRKICRMAEAATDKSASSTPLQAQNEPYTKARKTGIIAETNPEARPSTSEPKGNLSKPNRSGFRA